MHYVHNYILNPTHQINIALVGVGGTGSFILPELVALSSTLNELGRKQFKITVFDDDVVESHNVGRQKFFPTDIGHFKAEVLVNRVNRAYGTDVEYCLDRFNRTEAEKLCPNIIISCVDNLKTRKEIAKFSKDKSYSGDFRKLHYWFDCGNSKDYGQIILGAPGFTTINSKVLKGKLSNIIELFPDIQEDKNEPSCSLRASLMQQSFMVNKMTGVLMVQMLSTLLMDFKIGYNQLYFNLNQMNIKTNKL